MVGNPGPAGQGLTSFKFVEKTCEWIGIQCLLNFLNLPRPTSGCRIAGDEILFGSCDIEDPSLETRVPDVLVGEHKLLAPELGL